MEEKLKFFDGFAEESKPVGNCCKCGEKACVRSYGGEAGDYCFDCHFEMLKRINGINK